MEEALPATGVTKQHDAGRHDNDNAEQLLREVPVIFFHVNFHFRVVTSMYPGTYGGRSAISMLRGQPLAASRLLTKQSHPIGQRRGQLSGHDQLSPVKSFVANSLPPGVRWDISCIFARRVLAETWALLSLTGR